MILNTFFTLFLNVKNFSHRFLVFLLCSLFCVLTFNLKAQDEEQPVIDSTTSQPLLKHSFHAGLFVGAYWANKSTAYIYDGYGFDENGQRNSFGNSILYNQIVNVYGGGNGGVDIIAQLLNVDHKDWYFTEQDMPFNLRYTVTYLVGLNLRYQVNKKANITLNINGTKLSVNGKFNINSVTTNGGFQTAVKQNQFTIVGAEQRLMFQLGYQRLIGDNEKINLLVEGGLNIIMAKAQKNQAVLTSTLSGGQNNISIDLMQAYKQPPYNYYAAKYLIGVGIGVFGGIGVNVNINRRYSLQLLYSPSYDRVGLGYAPSFKLQHGFGLRVYYNMS